MPSKNTSIISARVKDETALKFTQMAENRGLTMSKLLDAIAEIIDENWLDEKGVTPHEYAVSDDFYSDDFGRKVEKKFDRLRERGYPEDVIHVMKEEILAGIESRIDMLPKKFDRRRLRDTDGGC